MTKTTKIAAIVMVVMALTLGQSMVMAAPAGGSGAAMAARGNSGMGIFSDFLSLFGLSFGNIDAAQAPRNTNSPRSTTIDSRSTGSISTDGAIWGGKGYCRTYGC